MERVHFALSKSHLGDRCKLLYEIFIDENVKDINLIYTTVVESLFGFHGQSASWGLLRVSNNRLGEDFKELYNLFDVERSFFRLTTKLSHDTTALFEFPQSYLPLNSQRLINEGSKVPLHSPSVILDQQGKLYPVLFLNAFEFYMYHFAYHLVNPNELKNKSSVRVEESVYFALLKSYLDHFLPIKEHCKPPSELILGLPKTPNRRGSLPISNSPIQSHCKPDYGMPVTTNSQRTFGMDFSLLPTINSDPYRGSGPSSSLSASKGPFLSEWGPSSIMHHSAGQSNFSSPLYSKPSYSSRDVRSADRGDMMARCEPLDLQIGTAYTFLQILIEFWLNVVTPVDSDQRGAVSQSYFIPTVDHVYCVRTIVKHLHYFTNNALSVASTQSFNSDNLPTSLPWEEFRRSAWSQLVQRKLYAFIKHCFIHWPADYTFRSVVELWLSCIQPWICLEKGKENTIKSESESRVDQFWRPFIEDNLLFYVQIFHHFLARASLMELTSEPSIYMIRRVLKVFYGSYLDEHIREVEKKMPAPVISNFHPSYTNGIHSSTKNGSGSHLLGSLHSPSKKFSSLPALLSQHFAEFEGHDYVYQSLFSESTVRKVKHLVSQLNEAAARLKNRAAHNSPHTGSWINVSSSSDRLSSENLLSEVQKCIKNSCDLFKIDEPDPVQPLTQVDSESPSSQLPETEIVNDRLELTPRGRYEMISGKKKFQIDYQGDPETQPIRSFECAWLVRALYDFSSWINAKYADDLANLSTKKDFISRVMLELIESTRTPYDIPDNDLLPPAIRQRRAQFAKPRISFRFLASYPTLCYLSIFVLVSHLYFGIDPFTLMLLVLSLYILYTALKVAMRSIHGNS